MAAHLDHAPRLASLPGPSRLVRISEPSWTWLRQATLGVDVGEPTPQQRTELVTAGLLIAGDAQADETASDPTDEGAVELEPHWQHAIATGLDSPVGVELVCLDGTDAWTTRLRVTGRTALLVDQVHAPEADGETVRLSHRSSAVTLGIAVVGVRLVLAGRVDRTLFRLIMVAAVLLVVQLALSGGTVVA